MSSVKELFKYSQALNLLYVEDDEGLRADMQALLSPLFKNINVAEDGLDGLNKYNQSLYDLVITDINMPKMNGIEMIQAIREINPEQKIVTVSAHNEGDLLISLIQAGVQSFILKPVVQKNVVTALYPVCRDAFTQNMNVELLHALNAEKIQLEKQNRELKAQANTIETKHSQLEVLLSKEERDPNSSDYFDKDDDEGQENVLLMPDHCDDLIERFNEIPELIGSLVAPIDEAKVERICLHLDKVSSIFMHYTPYVDEIALSLNELSAALRENKEVLNSLVETDLSGVLMLFDSVSFDMERYVKRFSVESLAMKNGHHIHKPTAMSIQQIIGLLSPSQADFGEIELF